MNQKKGFWIDENNNRWDSSLYSEVQAVSRAWTLKDCYNCKLCEGCRNYKYCQDCKYCDDCQKCIDCWDFRNCDGCKYCKECKECKKCTYCESCSNCKDCSWCEECHNCTGCNDCAECRNLLKGLRIMIKNIYKPKDFSCLEIEFVLSGAQKETRNDPGFEPWVDFEEIYINGIELKDEKLNSFFVENFGDKWGEDILKDVWY